MKIEIDTLDRGLGFDLMESTSLQAGISTDIPGGARLTFETTHIRKAFGIPETLQLALTFGTGVASGMVANWLFQKLNRRATKLRIDRTEIEIEEGAIRRVIETRVEMRE